MCDYSAHDIKVREEKAKVGDRLESSIIGSHGTIGFKDKDGPGQTVCMVPGTKLMITVPNGKLAELGVKTPTFAEFFERDLPMEADSCMPMETYRGSLRFENGRELLLQNIGTGVLVQVESVPAKTAVDHGYIGDGGSAGTPVRETVPA